MESTDVPSRNDLALRVRIVNCKMTQTNLQNFMIFCMVWDSGVFTLLDSFLFSFVVHRFFVANFGKWKYVGSNSKAQTDATSNHPCSSWTPYVLDVTATKAFGSLTSLFDHSWYSLYRLLFAYKTRIRSTFCIASYAGRLVDLYNYAVT